MSTTTTDPGLTQIRNTIDRADYRYHALGQPDIPDEEYDRLKRLLKERCPDDPILRRVGWPPSGNALAKVKHTIPMGSLANAMNEEEMDKWAAGVAGQDLFAEPKYDGVSCFDGDTLVHLANGETVIIREIVEGNLRPAVMTWDPDKGVTTSQVTNAFDNGMRPNWVRLTLEDGSTVTVTADHRFWVKNQGWTKAQDLTGKDLLGLT